MKNREKILSKLKKIESFYDEIRILYADARKFEMEAEKMVEEVMDCIDNPICYRLYLENGSKSMVVSWAIDEKNVPEKLIWDNGYLIPVNNNNVSPDIYGIGKNEKDAIFEYKICYLEEKFCFFKE